MEAELAALVTSGATTVVGLMATEAWEQARQRLVRLFARGGTTTAVDGELDELRGQLVAAAGSPDEEELAGDVTGTVRTRLRGLLRQDVTAADELSAFVDEFAPLLNGAAAGNTVHNSVTGGTVHGPVVQGYSFSNLTFGGSGGAAPDQNG
ncbi:hypothetical protein ACWEVM_07420 [Streptomyces bauhiniae]|uniref:hypothetical protein n=1 Tax=Streptomyces bauhiniae TaxID=2340725 RepID=UPI0036A2CCBB